MTSKKCTKCGESKDRAEFYDHPAKRDGLQSWCKLCMRVAEKLSYRAAKAAKAADATPTKRCTCCGEPKPLAKSGSHRNTKDGLNTWCNGCITAAATRRRLETRAKWAAIAAAAANA